ncbi:hypothetical protein BKI52_24915 [marine bacterium AO1-C]|nr:hypothetical protein BKI52_24915 [marine bacterium AO1-C]
MKKYLFTLLVACISFSGFAQAPKGYNTYHNQRFDFCVLYPHIFTKGMAPANGDGRSFMMANKAGRLLTFGSWQMPGRGLKKDYAMAQEGKKVTYKALFKNSYVVSGWDKERIFYQKTVLRKDLLITVYFDYLPSEKKRFDKIIATVTKSFPTCNK